MRSRRATSAGYRLPATDPLTPTSSVSARNDRQKPRAASNGTRAQEQRDPGAKDAVKQDRLWRESVRAEWEGCRQWQKNWSFLSNYDQLGGPREEKPLPEYEPVFSDTVPNTMNHTFGSRLDTELGQALIRMDNLMLRSNRKTKLGEDMLPC
ncbi:ciliary microtubule inner protein 5 [Amia ocellicauda]|uniref:ciliary microtubule inner protein 5 n=1 Tax=Amia ocellicauda TaxID=2972642 RepID=UPI003464A2C8